MKNKLNRIKNFRDFNKTATKPVQYFSDEYLEKCQKDGLKYQTQIKQLMKNWLHKF